MSVTLQITPEQVRAILSDLSLAMGVGTCLGVLAATLLVELLRRK